MPTHISLHHVGEVVLAGLLQELADRADQPDALSVPCVLHRGCSLGEVLGKAQVIPPIKFLDNVPLAPAVINGTTLLFDGAHGVDVLAHGHASLGVAFEAKLGLDRLAPAEFTRRFLVPTSVTGHKQKHPRVKGSMVAILNYRFLATLGALPLHTEHTPPIRIDPAWFVVIRRQVWEQSWSGGKKRPPNLAPEAHVVLFEDIVLRYGDAVAFDKLVQRLVGTDFFTAWGLRIGP